MPNKVALVTGITGQDGSYLAQFLLDKGYEVHGVKRRSSLFNTDRIDHLYEDDHVAQRRFHLHHGDLTDSTSILRIIQRVQPDEIYNLAAQSHVAVSFEEPEYTANADGLGALRILEAVRILGLEKKRALLSGIDIGDIRAGQGSAAAGKRRRSIREALMRVAKLYAYWITVNYREAYGIYACNGILFNHESPVRGETFVTRKITRAMARIAIGSQDCLYLGNLGALRDWGHARDYVQMQWLMLQQPEPEDFVIASGVQYSVREFVQKAASESASSFASREAVSMKSASSRQSRARSAAFRRARLSFGSILAISGQQKSKRCWETRRKPMQNWGWSPTVTFDALVKEMVLSDYQIAKRDALITLAGYRALEHHE